MFGSKPKIPTSLRIFEEMGVVATKDELNTREVPANDVYRMFNFNIKRIIQTRDVVWLGKGYNNFRKNRDPSNDDDKDDDIRDFMEG
jgi:hypothetical protein